MPEADPCLWRETKKSGKLGKGRKVQPRPHLQPVGGKSDGTVGESGESLGVAVGGTAWKGMSFWFFVFRFGDFLGCFDVWRDVTKKRRETRLKSNAVEVDFVGNFWKQKKMLLNAASPEVSLYL